MGAHYIHPAARLCSEARKLIELGEIEYMRQAGGEALAWISAHPAEFLWLIAQRFANLWAGPLHKPVKDSPGVLALTVLAIMGAWRSFPKDHDSTASSVLDPAGYLPADLLYRCLYAALQNTDRLDFIHPGRGVTLAVAWWNLYGQAVQPDSESISRANHLAHMLPDFRLL